MKAMLNTLNVTKQRAAAMDVKGETSLGSYIHIVAIAGLLSLKALMNNP